MLKLTMFVILEVVVGVALAAALLAVAVPLLIRYRYMLPGDLAGSVLIGAVLVLSVAAMLFRPGSAIRRPKN